LSSHKLIEIQLLWCQTTRDMKELSGQMDCPIRNGSIRIGWNEQGLITRVQIFPIIAHETPPTFDPLLGPDWIPKRALKLMEDVSNYFESGSPLARISWEDLAVNEWSDFQRKVYEATALIPHGETRTYGWVAQKIGKVLACRAVGQALRKNPLPLLVPCHRVVAHESLGGFMGDADPQGAFTNLKKQLLDLEHSFSNPVFAFLSKP
jgi:methylated-DNA-[protein]-cysteine S-methyltransferase